MFLFDNFRGLFCIIHHHWGHLGASGSTIGPWILYPLIRPESRHIFCNLAFWCAGGPATVLVIQFYRWRRLPRMHSHPHSSLSHLRIFFLGALVFCYLFCWAFCVFLLAIPPFPPSSCILCFIISRVSRGLDVAWDWFFIRLLALFVQDIIAFLLALSHYPDGHTILPICYTAAPTLLRCAAVVIHITTPTLFFFIPLFSIVNGTANVFSCLCC
ncbi:hypothetical protein BJ165DRAFT_878834 [Panaeolus papilionaceus]|nr:hypothetical protein BJ165DRAFT_878834 [Panaeolus papilionaceus]